MLFLSIIAAMVCEGIQPERLNAEGDSPSALSRGLSVSATPGIPTTPKEKRLNDAKTAAKASDIRVLRIMVGWHDTEGYASLHPRLRATRSARAFDLSGRAAVIGCGKWVIISLSEAVLWVGSGTPHRSLRSLCVVLTINQPLRGCAAVIAAEADFVDILSV